jgi:5,10-methylenetetrahydromethanopterin reductase
MKRIGLGFTGGFGDVQTYLDGASAAQRQGYEMVWLAEDYFLRDTVTLSTAVAVETTDVDVGVFLNPFTRHPALAAVSVASLNELTDAGIRVAYGAGPGVVMERFTDYDSPLWSVAEAIDVFRATLTDETVDYSGEHFEMANVSLGNCPYLPFLDGFDLPVDVPPVYVAAQGPQMLRMAGDVGDGLLISFGYTPRMAAETVDGATQGLAIDGRDEDAFDVGGLITASPDITDRVRQFAAVRIADLLDPEELRRLDVGEEAIRSVRTTYSSAGIEAAAEYVTDDMAETFTLITGREGFSDRLDEYTDAGVDVPILLPLHEDDVSAVVSAGAAWARQA